MSLIELLTSETIFQNNKIVDMHLLLADASVKTIQITMQSLYFNEVECQLATFRDITS
jgi:hypothetical protein